MPSTIKWRKQTDCRKLLCIHKERTYIRIEVGYDRGTALKTKPIKNDRIYYKTAVFIILYHACRPKALSICKKSSIIMDTLSKMVSKRGETVDLPTVSPLCFLTVPDYLSPFDDA